MNLGRAISLTNVQAVDYEPKAGGDGVDLESWEDVMGFVGKLHYPLQCLGMYCLTGEDKERRKLAIFAVEHLGLGVTMEAVRRCEAEIDAIVNQSSAKVCDQCHRQVAEWHAEFLFKLGWDLD
jgi:hypothetical protein